MIFKVYFCAGREAIFFFINGIPLFFASREVYFFQIRAFKKCSYVNFFNTGRDSDRNEALAIGKG